MTLATKVIEQILSDIWRSVTLPHSFRQALETQIYESLVDPVNNELVATRPAMPAQWCTALGGNLEKAAPLVVIWHLLHRASDILDQTQDGQRRFSDTSQSNLSINTAVGLIFAALFVVNNLEQYECHESAARAIRQRFYKQLLQITAGQHEDLAFGSVNLAASWEAIHAKSAQPIGLLFWSAARLISEDDDILNESEQLGQLLGYLIQISDDWRDLWSSATELSDLRTGVGVSLPISYALDVLSGTELESLQHYLMKARLDSPAAEAAEASAREIIISCGADIYLAVKLHEYGAKALDIVSGRAPHETQFKNIISNLTRPPWTYNGHSATGHIS